MYFLSSAEPCKFVVLIALQCASVIGTFYLYKKAPWVQIHFFSLTDASFATTVFHESDSNNIMVPQ